MNSRNIFPLLLLLPAPLFAAEPLAKPAGMVTFNKDIAPLVFKNCATCHRPGEVAPFSLLTYDDVRKKAKIIVSVTQDRFMPPWHAEPGFGEFRDSRRLSDQQIGLFKQWYDQGLKQGNPADLPATPKFVEGWMLGQPDLVLKMARPFPIPAEGPDIYQCFVLPTNLNEDKYLTAVEYRPGNRRVAHHSLLYVDISGTARALDAKDPNVGYRSFGGVGFRPSADLTGWAPGNFPRRLPDGVVRVIKKNSDLVVQAHYHPSGKPETDQAEVGLYFSRQPAKKIAMTFPFFGPFLGIPAGDKNFQVKASFVIPGDVEVISVWPHAHLLGKEMKITATLPDGTVKPMLWVKDWDFDWQDQYQYVTPIKLPKGTRLDMEHLYDNSATNLRNPNKPPKVVRWGEQTKDEMAICFFQFVIDSAGLNHFLLEAAKIDKRK